MVKKGAVLVTGGSGKLGRALINRLIKEGRIVKVLLHEQNNEIQSLPGVIAYIGELGDSSLLKRACREVETVFHLAAVVGVGKKGPTDLMKVNVRGTRNLVDAARAAKVERIIFASALSVYGMVRKEKLTEESVVKPSDSYGYSKALAEREVINSGLNYTIFRMATIYGVGFEDFFIKMARLVKEGRGFLVGEGKNHIPLVHISDVLNAFMLALNRKKSIDNIYIITDGRNYTQRDLLEMLARLVGVRKPERIVNPFFARVIAKKEGLNRDDINFLMTDKVVDISKAKKQLGFKPKKNIVSNSGGLLKEFTDYGVEEEFEV